MAKSILVRWSDRTVLTGNMGKSTKCLGKVLMEDYSVDLTRDRKTIFIDLIGTEGVTGFRWFRIEFF